MKIGIVTEWFDRGSAFVSLEMKRQLELQGFEVLVYARNEATELNQEIWPGEEVHVGAPCDLKKAKAISRRDFEEWVSKEAITHLIFNEQIWIPPVIWARKLGVVTVGYVDYYTQKSISSFKIYDALICNTKRHYSVFSKNINCWYIPWGTNLEKFYVGNHRNTDEIIFLHSAGWSPFRKGTDLCLKSFLKLENINARLLIHSQTDLREWLVSLNIYKEVDADPRIRILYDEIKSEDFMKMGDVYVYPSRLEGIGLTQAEALASGLPLIVPDEQPMSEFAIDQISRKTPISKRWKRKDGYFWDMVEIEPNKLLKDMQWFCSHISEKKSWQTLVRQIAEQKFDATKNFSEFGKLVASTNKNNLGKIRTFIYGIKYGAFDIQWMFLTPKYLYLRRKVSIKLKRIMGSK